MTELNIERERREFAENCRKEIAICRDMSDSDILENFTSRLKGWLAAKRAAVGSAEPVAIPAHWLTPGAVVPITADTVRVLLDAVKSAPPAPVSAEPVKMPPATPNDPISQPLKTPGEGGWSAPGAPAESERLSINEGTSLIKNGLDPLRKAYAAQDTETKRAIDVMISDLAEIYKNLAGFESYSGLASATPSTDAKEDHKRYCASTWDHACDCKSKATDAKDSGPKKFECKSSHMGAADAIDCEWPTCGCDPHADKVIAALQEMGALTSPFNIDSKRIDFMAANPEKQLRYSKSRWSYESIPVTEFEVFKTPRAAIDAAMEKS